MLVPMDPCRSDHASLEIGRAPEVVFAALADPAQLARWLPPNDMTGRVIEYDFRVGGRYQIELVYARGTGAGKTSDHTDVSRGRFLAIERDRRIVQSVEFESDDPAFAGEMSMTWTLAPTAHGTRVTITAANVPVGIAQADHEAGLAASLANLQQFLR